MRRMITGLCMSSLASGVACGGGGSVTTGGNEPGPVVTLRSVTDGPPAGLVADYLREHADERISYAAGRKGPAGIVRFVEPPVVRLVHGVSEIERANAAYAVALINRALPYENHLAIGPDAPAGHAVEGPGPLPHVPDGQIFVEFVNGEPVPGALGVAHADRAAVYDADQRRWEERSVRAGAVEVDREVLDRRPDHLTVSVLVHELLHVLGMRDHLDHDPRFAGSYMYDAGANEGSDLPAIDAAALQALYLRLGEATEPENLSPASLGPWSRETVHLTGRLGGMAWGVRHGNGVSVPWTEGEEPDPTALWAAEGTVTWDGKLLGFTPDQDSVLGDASIGIDLGSLNGSAEFTDLQSWPEGQTPGEAGTGTQWLDGDLAYTITVSGNYIRSTGGDAGTLSGRYYGPFREGVAGSVERDDLTAAFGAAR